VHGSPGYEIHALRYATRSDTAAGGVLARDWPLPIFTDLKGVYRGLETVRTLDARPGTTPVPGHDAAVMRMFETSAPERADLTRPLPP
jgi:hypothetical protein